MCDGDPSVYDRTKPELNNRLSTGNLPTRAQRDVCSFCAPLHLAFVNLRNLLLNRLILWLSACGQYFLSGG